MTFHDITFYVNDFKEPDISKHLKKEFNITFDAIKCDSFMPSCLMCNVSFIMSYMFLPRKDN